MSWLQTSSQEGILQIFEDQQCTRWFAPDGDALTRVAQGHLVSRAVLGWSEAFFLGYATGLGGRC